MQEKIEGKKVFLIIDGNAILHRAYHALPPLSSKDGALTNAVFGFFSMLLKLLQEIKPDYLAITFDRPKPTFRQTLFVGYHAQRPRMDEDLSSQIKIVHEILEEANICIYEVDGFEADDVIGTVTHRLEEEKKDTKVIVVSGDRDMLQLVDDDTYVLAPVIGISQVKLFDKAEVFKKYELTPLQIIDYKALAGDASDNYPGVPGIGPKTAIAILKKYGSLEAAYENIERIEKENNKLAQKLIENHDSATLAKKLATIIKDVPFSFSVEDCFVSKINQEKLRSGFEKYGFRSLIARLNSAFDENAEAKKSGQMKLI